MLWLFTNNLIIWLKMKLLYLALRRKHPLMPKINSWILILFSLEHIITKI